MRNYIYALAAVLPILMAGCAEKRPVLYPNVHLGQVGQQAAQADVDACIQMAESHQAGSDQGAKLAKSTATSGAVGAAVGGAVGAVTGNFGRGLAAGAAGGAAGGLTKGLFETGEPDPVKQRFVERCLRDKGYEPIGWR